MPMSLALDNVIGGETSRGRSSSTFEVVNPSTGAPLAKLTEATDEQVDAAVAAAAAAQRGWGLLSPGQRGEAMHEIASRFADRAAEFAELESIDAGKPITAARTIEI